MKKIMFLGGLFYDSIIQVGEQKYAQLFRKNGYQVFYLSDFLHPLSFIRRNPRDKELMEYWRRGIKTSEEGIFYYTPFCFLPYLRFPFFDNLSLAHNCLRFCYPNLKGLLEMESFTEVDMLFINNVKLVSILKLLEPKKIILRISDRIERFKNVPKTFGLLKEEISKKSDVVIVTSRNLEEETRRNNKNVFYVPNGIDRDFIVKKGRDYLCPKEMEPIKKPIVLYIGAIGDHFDFGSYEYGLSQLRDISFVMIGPSKGNHYLRLQQFTERYPNFHYLGPKKHEELKDYLYRSDLGVIPFQVNSMTNEINPVKFFEYVGYGLPVVASDMLELRNYDGYAFLYRNRNEYLNLIRELVNKKRLREKLVDFATKNTWEDRFDFLMAKIESLG